MEGLARDRDRQAEVDQPRHAVVAQDDVLRLDVAVQQAAGVDLGQPFGDLLDQPGTAPEVGPLVCRQLGQRTAGDIFHDQVDLVAAALHPVAWRDERAADPRQGAALVEHRLATAGGGDPVVALEHDQALQGAVARQVGRRLAAFSEFPEELVALGCVTKPAPRSSWGGSSPGTVRSRSGRGKPPGRCQPGRGTGRGRRPGQRAGRRGCVSSISRASSSRKRRADFGSPAKASSSSIRRGRPAFHSASNRSQARNDARQVLRRKGVVVRQVRRAHVRDSFVATERVTIRESRPFDDSYRTAGRRCDPDTHFT